MEFADLFSSDQHARLEAHRVLSDSDLLFAALMINASIQYPFSRGTEERAVSGELAQLCANAKTEGGAKQLAGVAFESCLAWFLVRGITRFGGIDTEAVDNTYQNERGFDMVGAFVDYLASMRFGSVFVNAALHAEVRYLRGGQQLSDQHTLVVKLVKHESDDDLIFSLMKGLGPTVSSAALLRLVELQATDKINLVAENPGSFFLRDSSACLAIANASYEVAEKLATTSNMSFIYRRAAMERMSDETVKEVADGSPHQNVRDSAYEVLEMRELVRPTCC